MTELSNDFLRYHKVTMLPNLSKTKISVKETGFEPVLEWADTPS